MAIRILIADDDSTIRMLLRRLLEEHSDWRVCSEAVNGVEAIEKVGRFAPDLAILDLGMPIMNGVQAAREISKSKPQLPLLAVGQSRRVWLRADSRRHDFIGAHSYAAAAPMTWS